MKRTHVHLYFCAWNNESRAWRAGNSAIAAEYAERILYVGHKVTGQPNRVLHAPAEEIYRIGPEPSQPGTSRIVRALSLPRWWIACLRHVRDNSVTQVTAHSLAALPAGVLLSKRLGVPLVYDAHELESEREGWSANVCKVARFIERRLIRFVDHLLVVNDSIGEWYKANYAPRAVTVLRNVPQISLEKTEGYACLRQKLTIPEDALIYIYCGSMGRGRGLTQKIEAFQKLGSKHHLVLMGYGSELRALQDKAKDAKNIHFHPAVPQDELIGALRNADVGLWIPDGTSLSYQYALPNKLFEYSAAGLALILGEGPELARYGADYPATVFTTANPERIADAIRAWSIDDIVDAKKQVRNYIPPHWDSEKERLFRVYDSLGL